MVGIRLGCLVNEFQTGFCHKFSAVEYNLFAKLYKPVIFQI